MTPQATPFDYDVDKLLRVKNGVDPKLVQLILEEGRDEWRKIEGKIGEMSEKIARYEDERMSINNALILAQKSADDVLRQSQFKADQILEDAKMKSITLVEENKSAIKDIELDLERLTLTRQKFADDFRALLKGYISELDVRFPSASAIRRPEPMLAAEPSELQSEATAD